ncbi:MAG: hypothetical protein ACO24O_01090 [Arenimonas sp.]
MGVGLYKFGLPLEAADLQKGLNRRHEIGAVHISESAVGKLNDTIHEVDEHAAPLTPDQIVTCGRRVVFESHDNLKLPLCILERFKTLALMDTMVKDSDWKIEELAEYRVEVVLDYVRRHEELIPHDAPGIGHLDDAILVESSRMSLFPELECYVDYRRLRKIEAGLQGKSWHEFRFSRENWLESREAEQALLKFHREQGLSSFLNGLEVRLFKIH